MKTPEELMLALQEHLEQSEAFGFVAITTAQMSDQIQQEIRGCGKHRLPAVLIVFDRSEYIETNTINQVSATLVVVDAFHAGMNEMSRRALRHIGTLQTLFPPEGTLIGEAFCTPGSCYGASADATFVCLAQEVTLQQGI